MPITVDAPRMRGGGVIEREPRDYRDPAAGELLIRIGANAICGSERHAFLEGSAVVAGHEAAGVVAATGPQTSTAVGTRGAVYLMDFCGRCRSCRAGATNQCLAKRADVGFTVDGGYGPYVLVHESHFFAIDDAISLSAATMLLDVMGTSGHALDRAELVRPDIESIAIAGAGPIGLGLLVMAKIRYGDGVPVYVSDLSPWRRDFAAALGAVPVDTTDPSALRDLAPDVAFDSTGRTVAREAALSALGQRGVLVCVGHGEGLTIDVSRDLIATERAVLGSEYFRFDAMAANQRLLLDHTELITAVITHELPVEQLQRGFELFWAGETGKVVITQEVGA